MKQFKHLLSEARLSPKAVETAVAIFVKYLERKLQTKFYRYGGKNGFAEIKHGVGILYMFIKGGSTHAVRFNYTQGDLHSMTVWNDYKPGKPGDVTAEFGNMTLSQIKDELFNIIVKPRVGDIQTYIGESINLQEAKRTTPDNFLAKVSEEMPGHTLDGVPFDIIKAVALKHDILIPSAVHSCFNKATKKYNLASLLNTPGHDKVSTKNDPTYYIKVTAQDPETKKFMTVKGDKQAENILAKIQGAISKPDIAKLTKNPASLFHHMETLVRVVARGKKKALVIIGGPGTGKSFGVFKTLEEEGHQKNKDWFLIKGKITTAALYQTLFMHREGGILVFDDADSVWNDQEAANILKAALDSYDVREISWISGRTVNVSKMSHEDRLQYNEMTDKMIDEDPGNPKIKYPSTFEYKGRIIFISNLPIEKMDDAVLNRSAKIDMTLTDDEMFARIDSILPNIGSKDVPLEVKKEILEFIKDQTKAGILSAPSLRTYVGAEEFYLSGIPDWRDMLPYM